MKIGVVQKVPAEWNRQQMTGVVGEIERAVNSKVAGPASPTDGHIAVFDGTSGELLKDGGATLATGVLTATSINFGDTALNYYKEGTWTPVLKFGGGTTGITYSVQIGNYIRIGIGVFVQGYFGLSSKGSSTGAATIAGLPFTPNATTNHYTLGVAAPNTCSGITGGIFSYVFPNNTALQLYMTNTGTFSAIADTNFGNSSDCAINASYEV